MYFIPPISTPNNENLAVTHSCPVLGKGLKNESSAGLFQVQVHFLLGRRPGAAVSSGGIANSKRKQSEQDL